MNGDGPVSGEASARSRGWYPAENGSRGRGIFGALVRNASELITVLDARGLILYESPSNENALGHRAEEVEGTDAFGLVHPDDRERVRRSFEEAVAGGEAKGSPVRFRCRHADGSWRHLESVGNNLLGHPEVGGFVVNSRDVTERVEAEERFRALAENIPVVTYMGELDHVSTCLYINPRFEYLLGYTPEERLAQPDLWSRLLHPEDREKVLEANDRSNETGEPFGMEYRMIRRDGRVVWVRDESFVLRDEGGRPYRRQGYLLDVTERKEAERALSEAEGRFRGAFENAPIGMALVTLPNPSDPRLDRRYLRVNRALCEILGYGEEDLLRKTSSEITHPDDLEKSREYAEGVILGRGQKYSVEKRYVRADGGVVWVLLSVSLVRDGEGNPSHFVSPFVDVTERREMEERLRRQALHDGLTGLPNRALFLDRLGHALVRSRRMEQPVAVLFVDLDDFKVVNDSLGHAAGNVLLGGVARRLKECVRPGDTVARLFGDEFAVLLEAPTGIEDARVVAARIGERLQAPFDVEGSEVFVSTSVGISIGSTAEDRPEALLRRADLAMYAAKNRGKARAEIYSPSMGLRATERMSLENELRRAVEREEFEVFYQPIVDVGSGTMRGVEALVRWRHPERGLVTPGEFIVLAEETGLIRPIGRGVLEEACRRAKEWRALRPENPPFVAVNLSTGQFGQEPDLIPETLRVTGLDPTLLKLEITERAVMDDAEFALGKLERLKGIGVRFAIDDYGMGYSCLHYLKHMPVDCLKIDRSFIAGLGTQPEDDAIVSGTVGLAHALGLEVVAEGVETAEQLASLKGLGCDMSQGFHLSHAVPAEEISAFLEGDRRWYGEPEFPERR